MSSTTTTRGSRARMRGRPAMAVAAGSTLLATLFLVAPPAQAVAPSNDNWENATDTGGLPYRTSVDTTDATRDAVNPPGGRGYRTWVLMGDGELNGWDVAGVVRQSTANIALG